jgi:L-alanine-DL-glutamate epimerase-like enolase superfamily enzyme
LELEEHPLTTEGALRYERGGGALRLPDGPGLGVELDDAAIREYRAPAVEAAAGG